MPKITLNDIDYALLPYPPEVPIIEKYQWFTNVFTSVTGGEVRTQMRKWPIRFLNYTVPLNVNNVIDDLHTIKGGIRDKWAIPMWMEAQFVGNIVPGQIYFDIDAWFYRTFFNDGYAFIYSTSDKTYEVVQIETIGTSLWLKDPGADARLNCYLMPLRFGYIMGTASTETNGRTHSFNITYRLTDSGYMRTDTVPTIHPLYKGNESKNGKQQRSVNMQQDIVDYKTGSIDVSTSWEQYRYNFNYERMLNGISEVWEFKNFFHDVAGKYDIFFQPLNEINLRIESTGYLTTTLDISSSSIMDYAIYNRAINFHLKDGSSIYALVGSFEQITPTAVRATFSVPSSLDIYAEDISHIEYLLATRLNNDTVQFKWLQNDCVEVSCSLVGVSI